MPDEVNPNPEDEIARQEEERREQENRRRAVKSEVVKSRNKIIEIRKQVAALTFDIARYVETVARGLLELRQGGRQNELYARFEGSLTANPIDFLYSECKLPREEAKAFLKLSESVDRTVSDRLSARPVSPAVLMALTDVDTEARHASVALIDSGSVLAVDDILKLGKTFVRERIPRDELFLEDRHSELQENAGSRINGSIASLERRVDALLRKLLEFWRVHMHDSEEFNLEPSEIDTGRPSYSIDVQAIRSDAKAILPIFEVLFGQGPFPRTLLPGMQGPITHTDLELLKAHLSLKRLVKGKFGHRGGFENAPTPDCPWEFDTLEALAFLSPEAAWRPPFSRVPLSAVPEMLQSVQFGEMTAGMAIGLYDGGFDARIIFEKSAVSRESLERNWPRWNVSPKDIRQLTFVPNQVDLLAGGLPSGPYAHGARLLGMRHNEELLTRAVGMVKEMRPRAFFFHVIQDILFPALTDERDVVIHTFAKAGYRVAINTLDGSDFSQRHSQKRIVLIGMSPEAMTRFRMPILQREKSVGDVIGDLMMVNRPALEIADVKRDILRNLDPAEQFAIWADRWMKKYGGADGPKVGYARDMLRTQDKDTWQSIGLRRSKNPAVEPPTHGDVNEWALNYQPALRERQKHDSAVGDKGFYPVPTIEMARRFFDFPREWQFVGEPGAEFAQIVGSFPPDVAKMIALAIYAALECVRFDMRHMEGSHSLPRHHIGEPLMQYTGRDGRIQKIKWIRPYRGAKLFVDTRRLDDEEATPWPESIPVRDRHPANPYRIKRDR